MAPRARPPLPLLLGLAVLTATSHFLAATGNAMARVLLGATLDAWPALLVLGLAGVVPLVAAWWMLEGAPRPGAALLTSSMLACGWALFGVHYAWEGPSRIASLPGSWVDRAYAATAYVLLALEILGFGLGALLTWRPQRRPTPPAQAPAPPASSPARD